MKDKLNKGLSVIVRSKNEFNTIKELLTDKILSGHNGMLPQGDIAIIIWSKKKIGHAGLSVGHVGLAQLHRDNGIRTVEFKDFFRTKTYPILKTEDGFEICETYPGVIYSCMKKPNKGEQRLQYTVSQIMDKSLQQNRLFFHSEKSCDEYIEFNLPNISKADLKKIGILDEYLKYNQQD